MIWKILNILHNHTNLQCLVLLIVDAVTQRDFFTGINLRYITFTEKNVSSQTAVYVHFSTPITEQNSELYWPDCIANLNLALIDKISGRL